MNYSSYRKEELCTFEVNGFFSIKKMRNAAAGLDKIPKAILSHLSIDFVI